MTRIVSLTKLSAADQDRIRREFPQTTLVDAGGWFDGEYAQTWPQATVRRYVPGAGKGTAQERDDILAAADVVIAAFPFPLDLKARAPKLKWLHQTPAGASNLRRGDIWNAGIAVTASRGLGETTASAEYVIASAMHFLKGFHRAAIDRTNGAFDYQAYGAKAIETRTLCVVGAGGIGREVGRLGKANGMRVIGTRRNIRPVSGDEFFDALQGPEALHQQLEAADIVAVCCQWTDETTNLLDDAAFAAMPAGAIVVNVARGEIIDEAALGRALQSGKLGGVALDVYVGEFEHPPPAQLWTHPLVLITPHTSGKTDASRRRSTDLFCSNLHRYLAGEPLENAVDWALGY
jgi:phosphoglycerate dehydrogenase-like enzyme